MYWRNRNVRSCGGTTERVRVAVENGSIRRFRDAEMSQCDTDDPAENGFGEYIATRFELSVPPKSVVLGRIVTNTPELVRDRNRNALRSEVPSFSRIIAA